MVAAQTRRTASAGIQLLNPTRATENPKFGRRYNVSLRPETQQVRSPSTDRMARTAMKASTASTTATTAQKLRATPLIISLHQLP